MDDKLLNDLGLSAQEIKIFRAVLRTGSLTPAALAKSAAIKRTTAYHVAKVLAERGLLVENATRRPRIFSPATPQDIVSLIDTERRRTASQEQRLLKLSRELAKVSPETSFPVPQIRYVEEEKLEKFLYSETPKWHQSILAADSTWWGFQDHTFIEVYGKITDWYWRKHKQEISVKLLSNQSDTEKRMAGKYASRLIKYWPKQGSFLSTTWVVGNYIVMVNTRQRPFYLVEIQNDVLAHDLREVFRSIWKEI